MTEDRVPTTEARWEEWARRLAPLIHDGLIDTPQERQIPDKAFYLARLLDEHLSKQPAPPLDPETLADVREQLERFAAIIEGRGEARLVAPHGMTSNGPRRALARLARDD